MSDSSTALGNSIASVVSAGSAVVLAAATGAPYVWAPGGAFPTVAAGLFGVVRFAGSVTGSVSLPAQYNVAEDSATAPVTIIGNGGSPQAATMAGVGQTYADAGGGGYFQSGSPAASTGSVAAGGNLWLLTGPASSYLTSTGQTDSIVANQGTTWIATDNSADHIWVNAGVAVIGSGGADTIATGAASAIVQTSGNALVFGGSGTLSFAAASGAPTVVGVGPALTVAASGSASLLAYGASTGGNVLIGDGAAATLVAGDNGDKLAALAGSDVLVAGSGNETLYGAPSLAGTAFVSGAGTALMVAQAAASDFVVGTGTAEILATGNANAFFLTAGHGGGLVAVEGFNATDLLVLSGYGANAGSTALAGAQTGGGNTVLTLADSTRIELLGFSGLGQGNLVA